VTILATKEVPVTFTIPDSPPKGYIADDVVVSVPETVTIAGRKATLDGITKITVADSALSIADSTSDLTTIINIKKYLPTGVQFADSSFNGNVSVTIAIEPEVTREIRIPSRNFAAGNAPDGFDVTLIEVDDNEPYVIKIKGTQSAVNAISANSVIGVVDMDRIADDLGLEKWASGVYTGTITFNLPDNVTLEQDYSMTLTVKERIKEDNKEETNDNGESIGN
jgi:hypothetical protein